MKKEEAREPICSECNNTGWRQYDHNHAAVCKYCCKHNQGWWELSENYAGYKAGEDNLCCKNGCGTMHRDLEKRKQ